MQQQNKQRKYLYSALFALLLLIAYVFLVATGVFHAQAQVANDTEFLAIIITPLSLIFVLGVSAILYLTSHRPTAPKPSRIIGSFIIAVVLALLAAVPLALLLVFTLM